MYTLGINAVYHDPAAALVEDGKVIAAAEEERFTHFKHGKRPIPFSTWELPFHAIDFCLGEAGIELADVDHVAYSYDPYLLEGLEHEGSHIRLPLRPNQQPRADFGSNPWDPLFFASILNAPGQLVDGAPHHLQPRFVDARHRSRFQWHYVQHHLAHAASAYMCAPFERSAVMTIDGRGERATTTYGAARGLDYELVSEVNMPHSLGLLYEAITGYLGFLHSSDEYKVMALASFGKPAFVRELREMIHVGSKGVYTIDELRLEERFGPRRLKGGPLEQRHYDLAHSLQAVLESVVVDLCNWLHTETGEENLCIAGGVGLNCVLNARIRDRTAFKQVWVQPAAGDAGTALGGALWVDARERKATSRSYVMHHAFLGPDYSEVEIEEFLEWTKVPYRRMENIAEETAEILADDRVIGWYQGQMEFGPRALGSRSILASPIHPEMQARLNEIKDREDFRPVAPVVLEEHAAEWFVGAKTSPFMLFIYDVAAEKADLIPAVRHVDGTARIQTISRDQHPLYYDLIDAFYRRTGVPVLVNTSFNTRGEPIVCTPRDAIESFWTSPLDALVIGPFLLEKSRMSTDERNGIDYRSHLSA